MLKGIEAQWRRRLWTLGTMAPSPLSPIPCPRCCALTPGSRWLSILPETAAVAASARSGTAPVKEARSRAPGYKPIGDESRRPPKNRQLVRPLMPYPMARPNNRSIGAVHRSLKAQKIHEDILGFQQKSTPLWTDTLRKLERQTPKRSTGWTRHALKIVIPAEAVRPLTTNLDNNIWDIHDRTTCEIELYKGVEKDGRSVLLLNGDDVVVQEASAIIMGQYENAEVFRLDPLNPDEAPLLQSPEIAEELCIKSSLAYRPRRLLNFRKSPYKWNKPLEDIPKPEVWDQYSFMKYIRTLSLASLPGHRAIEIYGTTQAADDVAVGLILRAFEDSTAIDAITGSAFRLALECMAEKGSRFRRQIRNLLTLALARRLPLDTTVFNKFLMGPTKTRDLWNFNQTLNLMDRYGCVPNYHTWRLFLRMLYDEPAKRRIVLTMDDLGILNNPHATSDVVREVVRFDVHRAIEGGKGAKDFCLEMDAAYGPTWPSLTTLNRILDVCGSFNRFDMCFELIDRFERVYQKKPENRTFYTLLHRAEGTNNFPLALEILRQIENRPYLRKTFQIYNHIFTLAWRWRLSNVMAVVWTCACLDDATTFTMRFRASAHLSRPGYEMDPNFLTPKSPRLHPFFALPAYIPEQLRSGLKKELEEHPGQDIYQGAVLARLYRRLERYEPTVALSEMIEKAWTLDKQLQMQRKAVSKKPGSHIVSIRPQLDGEQMYLDVPVRDTRQETEARVVKVPITQEGVVHNYEGAWYSDVERHPRIEYRPWKCRFIEENEEQRGQDESEDMECEGWEEIDGEEEVGKDRGLNEEHVKSIEKALGRNGLAEGKTRDEVQANVETVLRTLTNGARASAAGGEEGAAREGAALEEDGSGEESKRRRYEGESRGVP